MRVVGILVFTVLVLVGPASAQWEYGGKFIGIGSPNVNPKLAPDGSGGVYVVWEALSETTDSTYITVNHFDTAGVALFGENGVALAACPRRFYRQDPQIVADGYSGCFVLFTIGPTNNEGPMYLQRVNYTGEVLWPENRRLYYRDGVTTPGGDGMQMIADTSFGVIAVCQYRHENTSPILAQRTDYNGNLLWDSAGVTMTTPYFTASAPKLCVSNGNFYCVWGGSPLYLQRFDLAGNLYFDTLALIMSSTGGGYVKMVPDGFGGVVVAMHYRDPDHDPNRNATIKAQKVDATGHLYWGSNGIQVIDFIGNMAGISFYRTGNYFWVLTLRGYINLDIGGRFQKLDIDGNLLFGQGGRPFSERNYATTQNGYNIYSVNLNVNPPYVFWGSKRDTSWNELWPDTAHFYTGYDGAIDIMTDGLGGLYITTSQYRDWPTDWVTLQRIYPDGYVGGDTVEVGISEESPILPQNYLSLKVYPNPFNSTTLISFNVPSPSHATLKIFDALGRVVDTVEFGYLSVGRHSYRWDAERQGVKIASGSYFMSLEIGNHVETRRMVILK